MRETMHSYHSGMWDAFDEAWGRAHSLGSGMNSHYGKLHITRRNGQWVVFRRKPI